MQENSCKDTLISTHSRLELWTTFIQAHGTSWTNLHSHSHAPKLDQVQQEDKFTIRLTTLLDISIQAQCLDTLIMQANLCKDTLISTHSWLELWTTFMQARSNNKNLSYIVKTKPFMHNSCFQAQANSSWHIRQWQEPFMHKQNKKPFMHNPCFQAQANSSWHIRQ